MKTVDLGLAMREGMRRLASGVCVLSGVDKAGQRCAMTVSSVTSVSAEPPSLLVCIHKQTAMYDVLEPGVGFVINVLSSDQEGISNLCAGLEQGEKRFSLGDWDTHTDLPYLADGQSSFFCRADQLFEYGTHKIVVGCISEVLVSETEVNPLIYLNGLYHKV